MPLTASHALAAESQGHTPKLASRVLAGIESLILAGVVYLCASVSTTEKAMIKMQALAEANQMSLAIVPTLTIRMVEAEKDIQANTQSIIENKARIKELEDRANRRTGAARAKDDFSL